MVSIAMSAGPPCHPERSEGSSPGVPDLSQLGPSVAALPRDDNERLLLRDDKRVRAALHCDMVRSLLVLALAAMILAGCRKEPALPRMPQQRNPGPKPDEMPALLNTELPFRYPAALYVRKAQGNVTLMLYIDRDGRVVPESTRIDEPRSSVATARAPASSRSATATWRTPS